MSVHAHAITALVENEAGTINRVSSLFRRRGFSLASFNAGDCEREGFSRMTFLVEGDDAVLDQAMRQLAKVVDVVECRDLAPDDRIMREVALVSFDPAEVDREELTRFASRYGARTEFDEPSRLVLGYTGPIRLVEDFLRDAKAFPVHEIVRSGPCALQVR